MHGKTIMKKVLYAIGLTALLTACSHYSDEVTLEDLLRANNKNVKTEKVTAAPRTTVSREEMPTPPNYPAVQAAEQTYLPTPRPKESAEEAAAYTQPLAAPLPQSVSFTDFSMVDITPEVYSLAATRATNKMLDGSSELYFRKTEKPKLYISDVRKLNDKMPDGFYYARKVTNDIIEGSRNFIVVDNPEDADYQLEILINAIPTQYQDMPIIDYQLHLYSKDGSEINQWNATIKQLMNDDRSWW